MYFSQALTGIRTTSNWDINNLWFYLINAIYIWKRKRLKRKKTRKNNLFAK